MANGRSAGKRKNPVSVRGPWFAMPLDFLRSTACAQLPAAALKMLLDLCSQLGPNASGNGDLSAAPAIMVPRGWTSRATRAAALDELLNAELIVVTRPGNRKLCTLYAVTLWPLQCDLSKLSVGPGSFSSSTWMKGDKSLCEAPTEERPARWNSVRKNEMSPPAVGQPPADLAPQRVNPHLSDDANSPTAGPIGQFSGPEVAPLRVTSKELPSAGVVVGAAAAVSAPSSRMPSRPVLTLVEGTS